VCVRVMCAYVRASAGSCGSVCGCVLTMSRGKLERCLVPAEERAAHDEERPSRKGERVRERQVAGRLRTLCVMYA